MSQPQERRPSVRKTIETLRQCNQARAEVIVKLRDYQKVKSGITVSREDSLAGYRNGYAAELEYLGLRRSRVELLIESVERYDRCSGASQNSLRRFAVSRAA